MSTEYLPQVNVFVAPSKVSQGQMISIHASITDRVSGEPIPFNTIYMDIIDEDGKEYWPLSTIEQDSATISKLISTAELEAGKNYTVRISPSRKLSPSGSAQFQVESTIPKTLLLPGLSLIPHLLLSVRDSTIQEKVDSNVVLPDFPDIKIAWLVYRTQLDIKVCKYCKVHEGEQFRPNDPDLVQIPIHPKCRCHYDIISESVEQEIYRGIMEIIYHKQMITQSMEAAAVAKFHAENIKR